MMHSRGAKFVAYYRVSTERQGRSGLGLDAQRQSAHCFLGEVQGVLLSEFVEVESGRNSDRPQLHAAQRACRQHGATLLIAKLDRLARNVAFIAKLMEDGVNFIAVDMPHANKLTIHIMAAIAEYEREAISERTKAALLAAKARGIRLGNPVLAAARGLAVGVVRRKADQFSQNALPVIQDIQRSGITSLRRIAAILNARGVKCAAGGQWHATSVKRVLARVSNSQPITASQNSRL